jgi:hypothetical integral membrane protein (TIGR02206 family)
MKEFLKYFFGKGDTVEYTDLSLAHILPILIGALIVFLIYRCRNKLAVANFEKNIRYFFAFTLIICEMSYFWRLVAVPSLQPNPIDHLPITVCGWSVVLSSFMVVGKSQTLFDIVYFWLFSGTVFALITPTVITYTGPTRFRYYQFWVEHLLGYIVIFYMIFVHKMRPTIKSAIKSYAALGVLAVIAYSANRILGPGANYLFMARPEDSPSILDILPPNFILRLAVMASVITLMYFLAYLPWLIKDIKAKKAEKQEPERELAATK